jgi:hypothetical protein
MQTDRTIPVENTDPDQMDTLEGNILSDQMNISDDDQMDWQVVQRWYVPGAFPSESKNSAGPTSGKSNATQGLPPQTDVSVLTMNVWGLTPTWSGNSFFYN